MEALDSLVAIVLSHDDDDEMRREDAKMLLLGIVSSWMGLKVQLKSNASRHIHRHAHTTGCRGSTARQRRLITTQTNENRRSVWQIKYN